MRSLYSGYITFVPLFVNDRKAFINILELYITFGYSLKKTQEEV